jgi:hypothetical protein
MTKSVINDQQIKEPFGLQEVNQGDGGSDIVRFSLSETLTKGDDEVGQSRMFEHERNKYRGTYPMG